VAVVGGVGITAPVAAGAEAKGFVSGGGGFAGVAPEDRGAFAHGLLAQGRKQHLREPLPAMGLGDEKPARAVVVAGAAMAAVDRAIEKSKPPCKSIVLTGSIGVERESQSVSRQKRLISSNEISRSSGTDLS
jgi:hypothetical protein